MQLLACGNVSGNITLAMSAFAQHLLLEAVNGPDLPYV